MNPLRLLLIQAPEDTELIRRELERANLDFTCRTVTCRDEFTRELKSFAPDAVLAEHSLPSFDPFEALAILQDLGIDVPFMLVTASASAEAAVDCMKRGADDCIVKANLSRLPRALLDALKKKRAERDRRLAEAALRRRDERYRPVTESSRDLLCVSDGAEGRTYEETIRYLAYYDGLTGLPNRSLFSDRLSQSLAHAQRNRRPLGLMVLDIDRFKTVNDTLGHAVGDRLLNSAARRLKQCVREGDTIARLGGDEFMLLVSEVNHLEDVAKVAQRVLEALKPSFRIDEHDLHITASIGISLFPSDGADPESLLKNAEAAMYRAKELGRNNYQFYAPTMNATALERLALENSLRRALERDEFLIHYQPQVATKTGEVRGVEALVRWRHPEFGLVSPGRFVPIAEEAGLISALGEWVLRRAMLQSRRWQKEGLPPLRVGVNISPAQFRHNGLKATVGKLLDETDCDPRCLELELTESSIMQGADEIVETTRELKAMGVQVSIDDFGTGYSSLSWLKRFPIDALKIDQSFVRDITTNADDAAIANAILHMAHSLNLRVIAEGVETHEQLEFMLAHGCDEIQGYYISPPLSPAALARWLRDRR